MRNFNEKLNVYNLNIFILENDLRRSANVYKEEQQIGRYLLHKNGNEVRR